MEVVVEDKQLSLAIGKKGQNVRLAAKLTGWRIDIKSEEEKRREMEAQLEGLTGGASGDAGSDGRLRVAGRRAGVPRRRAAAETAGDDVGRRGDSGVGGRAGSGRGRARGGRCGDAGRDGDRRARRRKAGGKRGQQSDCWVYSR